MSELSLDFRLAINMARQFNGFFIVNVFFAFILFYLIKKGFSKHIIKFHSCLSVLGQDSARHYLARSYALNNRLDEAIQLCEFIVEHNSKSIETYYLLSDCYRLKNELPKAYSVLITVLNISKRLKTWLFLSNLVNTKHEFECLVDLWVEYNRKGLVPRYHYEVNGYIVTAALRAKAYKDAVFIVQELLANVNNKDFVFPVASKKKFTTNNAQRALLDLKKILDGNQICFFLVSGTLLGCIRNNKLLGHDKDIDIGVWDDTSHHTLLNAISSSGIFDISPIRSEHVLRVKHVNGVAIDLFYHYRTESNYWHGGSKLKWSNSPFLLVYHEFLRTKFLIPKNYDLYLTENYGDWRLENTDFDSSFDTTNSEIINYHEMEVHAYKKIIFYMKTGEQTKVECYKKRLMEIQRNNQ